MSDSTRRTADWWADGWFRGGDACKVHLLDNKPPDDRAQSRVVETHDGGRAEWWLICRGSYETCVVCDRGEELAIIERRLRDTCGCFTTCGEVCDVCV